MHVQRHHRLVEEAAGHEVGLGLDLGGRQHEGGDRVDHGHRHQPEKASDKAEDDVQALAVGELVPHVVPGVDDDDLTQEHESLDQKHPEEDVLQDREEDGEQRHQGEHERDRQGCTGGEEQDHEARQVPREALVVVLLRHHPQVLTRGRDQDRADNEGRKDNFKRPTKALEDALTSGRTGLLSMPGIITLEGGVPVMADDQIVGAIGISGMQSAQDGIIAAAALAAFGA